MLTSLAIILCHQNHSGVDRAGVGCLDDYLKIPVQDIFPKKSPSPGDISPLTCTYS